MNCNRKYILDEDIDSVLQDLSDPEFQRLALTSGILAFVPTSVFIFLMLLSAHQLRNSVRENKELSNKIRKYLKDDEWTVKIVDDDQGAPTAYCLHTKDIYVSKGLIKMLTPRELMAVLLHEAYHIEYNHSMKKVISRYPVYALVIGMIISSGLTGPGVLFLFLIMSNYIAIPLDIVISRKMELNSDSYAVKHGYGDELISALNKLHKKYKKLFGPSHCNRLCQVIQKMNETLSSHPSLKKRIENILKQKELYEKELTLQKTKALVLKFSR